MSVRVSVDPEHRHFRQIQNLAWEFCGAMSGGSGNAYEAGKVFVEFSSLARMRMFRDCGIERGLFDDIESESTP